MRVEPPAGKRELRRESIECDLAVVGGGMAGVCAAVTAARAGARVTLVQDRPVLGGNASSEVRLWVLGATAHMGAPNRWARESGVIGEILVENVFRNPQGNPVIFDTIVLEWVAREENVRLLLNTAVFDVEKTGECVSLVRGFNPQDSTVYEVNAQLVCDASGDGIVAFLAGAGFRVGAESRAELGEGWAPDPEEFGECLGHTILFYAKDTGGSVEFIPPAYAMRDVTERIPRWGRLTPKGASGCHGWWLEWGGRLDTVHDTEKIKWQLWSVVYGVWDHIKHSGRFPEAESLTLEWVGLIPGKRESRRFEGPHMLTQAEVLGRVAHCDDVSYGGWSIDLHPADGVYSPLEGSTHLYAKGVYPIPFRTMFSRDVPNLLLAGRIVSSSHVAFGTTRVIATCACSAQAAGMAAAICARERLLPADLARPERVKGFQQDLMRAGQHIPGLALEDPEDLARGARVSASSEYALSALAPCAESAPLDAVRGMILPLAAGEAPEVSFVIDADAPVELAAELRVSERPDEYSFEVKLAEARARLDTGKGVRAAFDFDAEIDGPRSALVCLRPCEGVRVRLSDERLTGVLSVRRTHSQKADAETGADGFDFWLPERRPGGKNLACEVMPSLRCFAPRNVTNGVDRPTCRPNAWLAAKEDDAPALTLAWDAPVSVGRLELAFDTDFDHPMESMEFGHPERAMPFCVKRYRVEDSSGRVLHAEPANHQTRNTIRLAEPVETDRLVVKLMESWGDVPAALFGVRCYEE